jgi:hypothetical protein
MPKNLSLNSSIVTTFGDILMTTGVRNNARGLTLILENGEALGTEAYRTLTDAQNSGRDLQVVDEIWRPRRDLNRVTAR